MSIPLSHTPPVLYTDGVRHRWWNVRAASHTQGCWEESCTTAKRRVEVGNIPFVSVRYIEKLDLLLKYVISQGQHWGVKAQVLLSVILYITATISWWKSNLPLSYIIDIKLRTAGHGGEAIRF